VGEFFGGTAGQPAAFMTARVPSFTDFLAGYAPDLLPVGFRGRDLPVGDANNEVIKNLPHATTIVAAVCERGVVMAGDRRATSGNMISKRDAEKVFRSDEFSAMAIAGVFAIGIEFVRLFQVELEHYEKMEGRALSLEGKANRLAKMVRDNLGPAMQGLAVVPLFTGYDEETGIGRIFSYDVAGGPYEEHRFYSIGSGSIFARGSLKKLYRDGMSTSEAVVACVQALYDAADDDSATGGPDLTRQLFPIVATITDDGFRRLPESETAEIAEQVVAGRMQSPDGPNAPLRTAS
jgi:proteasome beta subunit